MTFRELYDMVRKYSLDPDSELMMRPLLKDKVRKVESVSLEQGKFILTANKTATKKKR